MKKFNVDDSEFSAKRGSLIKSYTNLAEMLKHPGMNAVSVCSMRINIANTPSPPRPKPPKG